MVHSSVTGERRETSGSYRTLAEYCSTSWRFWIKANRSGRAVWDSRLENRPSLPWFTTSTVQCFNHSMRYSTDSVRNLFILLASMASLVSASGGTPPPGRFPEPLEKSEMQPAPRVYRLETSPRMISQFGVFTSYQVNVDANGNNIVGDAANECAISVDPTNGDKMTIAWRQFNDVTSNFRQGGWGYTTDAGITWTFPGVLQNNVFRSDPVTQSNEVGQFFYLSLQSDSQQSFYCDDLWRSTNGGQTWTEQSPDRSAGGDKAWLA